MSTAALQGSLTTQKGTAPGSNSKPIIHHHAVKIILAMALVIGVIVVAVKLATKPDSSDPGSTAKGTGTGTQNTTTAAPGGTTTTSAAGNNSTTKAANATPEKTKEEEFPSHFEYFDGPAFGIYGTLVVGLISMTIATIIPMYYRQTKLFFVILWFFCLIGQLILFAATKRYNYVFGILCAVLFVLGFLMSPRVVALVPEDVGRGFFSQRWKNFKDAMSLLLDPLMTEEERKEKVEEIKQWFAPLSDDEKRGLGEFIQSNFRKGITNDNELKDFITRDLGSEKDYILHAIHGYKKKRTPMVEPGPGPGQGETGAE